MKKFAVILAGCGVFDGAEIHEATLTLLAIMQQGGTYKIFAPDINQHHVVNHLTGKEMPEKRNVLVESARIARGKILPLSQFDSNKFDAIIFPGGFGVAKNLSTYAKENYNCKVNNEVAKAIFEMNKSGKPIGALCIAPVILAKILGNIKITTGQDINTANNIKKMGAIHENTSNCEIVIDLKNKIVTSPCYMLDSSIVQIAEGIENAIKAVIKLIK